MIATEDKAACKHLASRLTKCWTEEYSVTCGFISLKISLALVRARSLCICGAREHRHQSDPMYPVEDGVSMVHYAQVNCGLE